MRLLIVTQKIDSDDPLLGFFMRWIEEFAHHAESIVVICLERGEGKVPENVRVLSLGKESSSSRFRYLFNFYRYLWKEKHEYDTVFVHMNQEYVLLGGLLWKLLGKRVGLWYTHKSVDWKLRIAEVLADIIFTASKESFRLPSRKVIITGHGIDTEFWKPLASNLPHPQLTVLSVGRISPVKKHEAAIFMAEALNRAGRPVKLLIVGRPARRGDEEYLRALKEHVERRGLADTVTFLGSLPSRELIACFQKADIIVNASETGSLDKVVLEAMSSGLIPITSNEAYKPILAPFGLFVGKGDFEKMRQVAERLMERDNRQALGVRLRDIVIKDHNLKTLVGKIFTAYAALKP